MTLSEVLLWTLTALNSFAILLVIRQLARLPIYRTPLGPQKGSLFTDWTLWTTTGTPRTSAQMPIEYTFLVTSENCSPCHALVAELARAPEAIPGLIIAADDDEGGIVRVADARGVCDEFLTGVDPAFRQRFLIPGTPYVMAIRQERVVRTGPARTREEVLQVAQALRKSLPRP